MPPTTKHKILSLLLFLFTGYLFAQTTQQQTLLHDFSQDSLGCKGLRLKHLAKNQNLHTNKNNDVLFDSLSIIGQSKQQIIDLLGPPNYKLTISRGGIFKNNVEQFQYYITTCGGKSQGQSITIILTNGVVTATMLIVICG